MSLVSELLGELGLSRAGGEVGTPLRASLRDDVPGAAPSRPHALQGSAASEPPRKPTRERSAGPDRREEWERGALPGLRFGTIKRVRFSLMSTDEIVRGSACEVTDPSSGKRPFPPFGGTQDLRLGTTSTQFACSTCANKCSCCYGHYGHIALPEPVYHPGYIKTIRSLLLCVCIACSRFRIPPGDPRWPRSGTLAAVASASKLRTVCPHAGCRMPQPNYSLVNNAIMRDWSGVAFASPEEARWANQPFVPKFVRSVLEGISNEDLARIQMQGGFTRPESMVLEALIVSPNQLRPANAAFSNGMTDDKARAFSDTNSQIVDILKAAKQLRVSPPVIDGLYPVARMEQLARLQTLVSGYLCGTKVGRPKMIPADMPSEVIMPRVTQQTPGKSGPAVTDLMRRTFVGCCILAVRGTVVASAVESKSGAGTKVQVHVSASSTAASTAKAEAHVSSRLRGKRGLFRHHLTGKRVDLAGRSVIAPWVHEDVNAIGIPTAMAMELYYPVLVSRHNIDGLGARVRLGARHPGGARSVHLAQEGVTVNLLTLEDTSVVRLRVGDTVSVYLSDGDMVLLNRQPSLHRESILAFRVVIIRDKVIRVPLAVKEAFNNDFDGDEMNIHVPYGPEEQAEMRELMLVDNRVLTATSHRPIVAPHMDALLGLHLLTQEDAWLTRSQAMQLMMAIHYPRQQLDLTGDRVAGRDVFSCLLPTSLNLAKAGAVVRAGRLVSGSLSKASLGAVTGSITHLLALDQGGEFAVQFISDCQRLSTAYLSRQRGFSLTFRDMVVPWRRCRGQMEAVLDQVRAYVARRRTEGGPLLEQHVTDSLRMMLVTASSLVQAVCEPGNSFVTMKNAGSKGSPINMAMIAGLVGQQTNEGRRLVSRDGRSSLPCYPRGPGVGSVPGMAEGGMVASSFLQGLTVQEFFFHCQGGREGIIDTAVKTGTSGSMCRRLVKAMESIHVTTDGSVRTSSGQLIQTCYGGDGLDVCRIERVTFPGVLDPRPGGELLGTSQADLVALYEDGRRLLRAGRLRVTLRYPGLNPGHAELERAVSEFQGPVNAQRIAERVFSGAGAESAGGLYDEDRESTNAGQLRALAADVRRLLGPGAVYFSRVLLGYLAAVAAGWLARPASEFGAWCTQVRDQVARARVHAGEMVGVLGATSIGEPATQMTLNTFHLSVGNKTVQQGIPRFTELADVSPNPKTPSMHLRLAAGLDGNRVWGQLEQHALSYFVQPVEHHQLAGPHWMVRYRLNASLCHRHGVSLLDLYDAMEDVLQGLGVLIRMEPGSGDTSGALLLHLSDPRLVLRMADRRGLFRELLATGQVAERERALATEEFCRRVVEQIPVTGVPGVQTCYRAFVPACWPDGSVGREWALDTDGSNLAAVLQLDRVFTRQRCYTNVVMEAFDVLGIHGAHSTLLHEMTLVLTEPYVNQHHIRLLCDTICAQGHPFGSTRHGAISYNGSVFSQAANEEGPAVCMRAAQYAEVDEMRGVTENLMVGNICPAGTGLTEVLMDRSRPADPGRSSDALGELERFLAGGGDIASEPEPAAAGLVETRGVQLLTRELLAKFMPIPQAQTNTPRMKAIADARSASAGLGTGMARAVARRRLTQPPAVRSTAQTAQTARTADRPPVGAAAIARLLNPFRANTRPNS